MTKKDVEIVDQDMSPVGRACVRAAKRPAANVASEASTLTMALDTITRDEGQQHGGHERNADNGIDADRSTAVSLSPRNDRCASTSTVSKRSRMRNTNTPNTNKAIRIENATLELDHERHALGAGGRQDQAVLDAT